MTETHTVLRAELPNGLKVVVVHRPYLHLARATLFIGVGARSETNTTSGISHLTEHMMFKGCEGYPSSQSLDRAVEKLCGGLNGSTGYQWTTLDMDIPPYNLDQGLAILSSIVRTPVFSDLEIERGVILSEIQDSRGSSGVLDDPVDMLHASVFKGSSLERTVLGTPENIKRFTVKDVRRHHGLYYRANNMVLVVASPMPSEGVLETVREHFSSVEKGSHNYRDVIFFKSQARPRVVVSRDNDESISLTVGFRGVSIWDPQTYAQSLIARVLDDGMSSMLPHHLRTVLGAVYSVGVIQDSLKDTSLFGIWAKCDRKRVLDVVGGILHVLMDLMNHPLSEDDLDHYKKRGDYHMETMEDSMGALTDFYGMYTSSGIEDPTWKFLDRTNHTSPRDILRLSNQIFHPSQLNISITGKVPVSLERRVRGLVSESPYMQKASRIIHTEITTRGMTNRASKRHSRSSLA